MQAAASGGAPESPPETVKTAGDLDGAADRWLSTELVAAAGDWIARSLAAHDGRAVSGVHQAQVRPWGLVLRVDAAGETFWFKANAEGGAQEPALMRWLGAEVPGQVPATIALDLERRWWLAADVGSTLADRAASAPIPPHTWRRALTEYAGLQRRLETRVSGPTAVDVPWFPPAKVAQEFVELLDRPARLLVGDARGLTRDEHRDLLALVPTFTSWCGELESAGIPLSIQHDDLSEANVCHHRNTFTFIDWADAHVGQPFGSLIFPLRVFREQHGLAADHPEVLALADAYLAAWEDRWDRASLRHLTDLAVRVAVVPKALAWTRALLEVDRRHLNEYYASPEARWLRKLLGGGPPY